MDKPLPVNTIPRRVCEINNDGQNSDHYQPSEYSLEEFRGLAAWVLLGEPGAGKSTSLQQEAELTGGIHLSVAEFISEGINPDWSEKTLFLDGLDEIRASGKEGEIPTIRKIYSRLKELRNPAFRLSCRAADWYGSSDSEILKSVSPSKNIAVLQLEPLNRNEIQSLLRGNLGIANPKGFIDKAEKLGVDELLNNPQTLELLVKAITGERWPANRNEAYQLACKKMVAEANKNHRNLKRVNSTNHYTANQLLDATGQLCAVLLLADQTGLALDEERKNRYFINIEQCDPPNLEIAKQAAGSKLFRPMGEERITPCHRSLSEYLASKWLAQQIDQRHLPLTRLLNLLLGADNGVVAGLRGLYGWLALHCQTARNQLIKSDVLAVVLYGDPKPMTLTDKRQILQKLRHNAECFTGFRAHLYNKHSFGSLAAPELEDDLKSVLHSMDRDNAHQSHVDCVLDILDNSESSANLTSLIYQLIIDNSYWPGIRTTALRIWLKIEPESQPKVTLLNNIRDNIINDDEDALAGQLLRYLYPSHLQPKELLTHLHIPKRSNLLGGYYRFWHWDIVETTPDSYLQELMDELPNHKILNSKDSRYDKPTENFFILLNRCVKLFGGITEDKRLLTWLKLRMQDNIYLHHDESKEEELFAWFKKHPTRYKSLLKLCYENEQGFKDYEKDKRNRLRNIPPPPDLGLWHFQQANSANNPERAKLHFEEAFYLLAYQPELALGLTLDMLIDWTNTKTEEKQWLQPLLTCAYPDWHTKESKRKKESRAEKEQEKSRHTQHVEHVIEEVAAGIAPPYTMNMLTMVRENRFSNVYGSTARERFENFFNNSGCIYVAAEKGLKLCPERDDLPTDDEIIKLYLNNQQSYLQLPCLLGMSLRYKENLSSIIELPHQTLKSIIAFHLVSSSIDQSGWMNEIAKDMPELVADVLINYIKALLKLNKNHLNGIHELETINEYKEVAKIVAPEILKIFPLRANAGFLSSLKKLLKVAIRYTPEKLPMLIEEKLSKKAISVTQKIYWYATALMIDSETYETQLWNYIKTGDSNKKANSLAEFFSNNINEIDNGQAMPISTLGKLIETLAPLANMRHDSENPIVTRTQHCGDNIRLFISQIETSETSKAIHEINRLLALESTKKVHYQLKNARNELLNRQREERFTFLSAAEVASIINNKAPANAADLLALTNDTLEDIANDIRNENDDGYRIFWNIEERKPISQRVEDECRDELLRRLRNKLQTYNIDCQREASYSNNKRADIRLSYQADFELPIEIKRDSHDDIWKSIQQQLVEKYTIAPNSKGHGIYLVLWFGGKGPTMSGGDGSNKPQSAQELKKRLTATISSDLQKRISVHVIDVSWPQKT